MSDRSRMRDGLRPCRCAHPVARLFPHLLASSHRLLVSSRLLGVADPGTAVPTVRWFGDGAVLVDFGLAPSAAASARVEALLAALDAAALPGVAGLTPAYSSILVQLGDAIDEQDRIMRAIRDIASGPTTQRRVGRNRTIPVLYGGGAGPDLEDVARESGLAPSALVALHVELEQVVLMLGFSPGFPYIGDLPFNLAIPRRTTPRESVPAGSVGLAGFQTGIYPRRSPGGWQLIGRTPVQLFDARACPPTYLRVGDRVRFRAITASEWDTLNRKPPDW